MVLDYKTLGLKVGIEIHRQLATNKLFCSCPSRLREDEPDIKIKRFLRPVAGELGKVDIAALHEAAKRLAYIYEAYSDSICLVELDESPPFPINQEALEAALAIALLLNAKVFDEIQVMRKTVLDGSNTSGFQRTALIARGGAIETQAGKIAIQTVCLEEDAARIIEQKKDHIIYRLDRLGIPLIEVATAPEIKIPQQARDVALALGALLKATGKVKTGIGTIRQDLNVSIRGGTRTEIKGVQEPNLIPLVIQKEVERQLALIKAGKKVAAGVRKALSDGSTEFMRPMPGEARMYPETDLPYVQIDKTRLARTKGALPEPPEKKRARFIKAGLGSELASQILESDYLQRFETAAKKFKRIEPRDIATIFVNTLPDLQARESLAIETISQEHIEQVLALLQARRIIKEAVPLVFKELAKNPSRPATVAAKAAGLERISDAEAAKIIRGIIAREKGAPVNALIGAAMQKLRGRLEGGKIARIVKELMRKGA